MVDWSLKQLLHYIASGLHLMMKYPLLYVFFPNNCVALKVFLLRIINLFSLFVPKVTLVSHERKFFSLSTHHISYHINFPSTFIHFKFFSFKIGGKNHIL